jgi:hypothetical protein
MSSVAIESSYRLNILRAVRSLAIDHVPQTAQGAVKAGGWHRRVASAEFDIDRFSGTFWIIEEKISMIGIDRISTDELKALGREKVGRQAEV